MIIKSKSLIINILCFLVYLSQINAQVVAKIKLKRSELIPYEPAVVEITLQNRAGRNIILGDSKGKSWLNFTIKNNYDGRFVHSSKNRVSFDPLFIKVGEKITREVNLGNAYPISATGTYSIQASIYNSLFDNYYKSNNVIFNVLNGRTISVQLNRTVTNKSLIGEVLQYSLISLNSKNRTKLYCKIENKTKNTIVSVVLLGAYIRLNDPQVSFDGDGNYHILFQINPETFKYLVLAKNGFILKKVFYSTKKSKPVLTINSNSVVTIKGGVVFDPNKKDDDKPRYGKLLSELPNELIYLIKK